MKYSAVLFALLIPVCCLGALEMIIENTGHLDIDASAAMNPGRFGVQDDGTSQVVYKEAWNILKAVNKAGVEVWSFTLDPAEVCPSCGTEPDDWYLGFVEFVDTEVGQRDGLVNMSYNPPMGDYIQFVGLVGATTGVLRQTIPSLRLEASLDLDNDGLKELLLVSSDGHWEVWGGSVLSISTEDEIGSETPQTNINSLRNSPNPFNPSTRLQFNIQRPGAVRIEMFNPSGRMVDVMELGRLPSGAHEYTWYGRGKSGRPLPSGNYYYSIVSDNERQSRKMLLLK